MIVAGFGRHSISKRSLTVLLLIVLLSLFSIASLVYLLSPGVTFLAASPAFLAGDQARIPCVVHQIGAPQEAADAADVWLRCLPGCRHRQWSPRSIRLLVISNYPWLLPVFTCGAGLAGSKKHAAGRNRRRHKNGMTPVAMSVSKFVLMLHFGGIYADAGTDCLRNFRHLLEPWRLVFGGATSREAAADATSKEAAADSGNGNSSRSVHMSFMASEPFNPLWMHLLVSMSRSYWRHVPGSQEEEDDPGLAVLTQELGLMQLSREEAHIFPGEYFSSRRDCKNREPADSRRKQKGKLEENCISASAESYIVR